MFEAFSKSTKNNAQFIFMKNKNQYKKWTFLKNDLGNDGPEILGVKYLSLGQSQTKKNILKI